MSRIYWRPIPISDVMQAPGSLAIAGGWCRFDRVERLERGEPPRLVALDDVPADVLARLSAPRAPIAAIAFDAPRIMGILNVTPDSFSDGGRFDTPPAALAQALDMATSADILDIGAESTRPGAAEVPEVEEWERVRPVLDALGDATALPISIDTRKAGVARAALSAGATIVNDVSALAFDPAMANVAATAQGVCLMHAQGTPETMQIAPAYDDVVLDVYDHLEARLAFAERHGIDPAKVILDPGLGFGKSVKHNVSILARLSLYHGLGCAVLVGASRKGFIGTLGGAKQAQDRMPGSVAVALHAVGHGAQIVRVHDVHETRQALSLRMAVNGPATGSGGVT